MNDTFKLDKIESISPKQMMEHAKEAGYTAKDFSIWAKAKGYSAKLVLSMTQQYMEQYQREGTSKNNKH